MMNKLRPDQVARYFERDYFEDFGVFEKYLYTCIECGALVSDDYRADHAEWHERLFGRGTMTDDVSKLPAWPRGPITNTLDPDYELAWLNFHRRDRDAYRARMEALVEYVQHADDCEKWDPESEGLSDTLQCDCGLDALLAACVREEGR